MTTAWMGLASWQRLWRWLTLDTWMCCTDPASSVWEAPISRAFDVLSKPEQTQSVRWTQISLTRLKKSRFCWRRFKVAMSPLQSCDVAIGSRYVPGGSVDADWPMWRKALSAFGNFYARTILHLPIRDVTGGFKVWRSETLSAMPLDSIRSNGYAFQVEMAYVAYRLGFTFKEIPIYFADRRWGLSKMSFRIQREAALRVWQVLYEHRRLTRKG